MWRIDSRRRGVDAGGVRPSLLVAATLVYAVLPLGAAQAAAPVTPSVRPHAGSVATATPVRVLPPVNAAADYQLGGAYVPARGVRIVTRDVTERPAPGTYGICYVNAFQTQPGTASWWLRTYPRLVLRTATGAIVRDPGWPDEMLLDTSAIARSSPTTSTRGRARAVGSRCG